MIIQQIKKDFKEKKYNSDININTLKTDIRMAIKSKSVIYFNCDLSKKINSDGEDPLTDEQISSVMKNVIEDINKSIKTDLTPEKIYEKMGISKEDRNVCVNLPPATFLGIPKLTHKVLKKIEKKLKRKSFTKTGKIVGDTEEKLCVSMVEALVHDLVDPVKDIFKQKLDSLLNKLNKSSTSGGGLIGEGTYGCVFRPHLYCNGKESTSTTNFASKLIIAKKSKIEKEFRISNIIKTIPNYQKYFVPLLEICPVNVKQIKTSGKEDCKLINKKTNKDKLSYIAKMKYIKMLSFNDFITKNDNLNNFINFISIFPTILKSVNMMIKKKIVHYDLHGGNIIIEKQTNQPIIIDFGLAFSIKK